MSAITGIEWCDSTLNFWEGCTEASTAENGGGGCDNCYAKRMNAWLRRGENWGPGAPRRRFPTAHNLALSWQRNAEKFRDKHGRNRRVFVNSISDWADNEVPSEWRADMFATIQLCPDITFLLLTKRIGNARRMIEQALIPLGDGATDTLSSWPWPHVWLGATVINQREADRDVGKLLDTPAAVRFLSIEPMLGAIDLGRWLEPMGLDTDRGIMNPGLQWVISGGETGRGVARPSHPDWHRSLRDQCAAAGAAYFFKQWGGWCTRDDMLDQTGDSIYTEDLSRLRVDATAIGIDGRTSHDANLVGIGAATLYRVGKAAAGRLLDGRTHDEFPEVA